MRTWLKAKVLPYVVGKHPIYVSISHDGLTFWKKGKREKVFVPWEKIMPWRAIYVGDKGDPYLHDYSAAGTGSNGDDG